MTTANAAAASTPSEPAAPQKKDERLAYDRWSQRETQAKKRAGATPTHAAFDVACMMGTAPNLAVFLDHEQEVSAQRTARRDDAQIVRIRLLVVLLMHLEHAAGYEPACMRLVVELAESLQLVASCPSQGELIRIGRAQASLP